MLDSYNRFWQIHNPHILKGYYLQCFSAFYRRRIILCTDAASASPSASKIIFFPGCSTLRVNLENIEKNDTTPTWKKKPNYLLLDI